MHALVLALTLIAGPKPEEIVKGLLQNGLTHLGAHEMLTDLVSTAPHRLSGSEGAAKAVDWVEAKMKAMGLAKVRRIACKVPHWVRGPVERAEVNGEKLAMCALGNSGAGKITANVLRVTSLKELEEKSALAKGKIVFFDRPFDPTLPGTMSAYGGANDQRTRGPQLASKFGAVGALVRSMTLAKDDVPHTGNSNFGDQARIPAAALGVQSADRLARTLRFDPYAKVSMELACELLPDADSANVIGEITGSEKPNEVIVIGGHLDCWDKGQGAHDDGAGVCQSLEVARLFMALNIQPKRTIRIVAFMNEENGLRGGTAYAEWAKTNGEKAYVGMESDSGGFMPREFNISAPKVGKAQKWLRHLNVFGIERITPGGGGADVGPLGALGAILVGLEPDNQRYFDYHHSDNDTLDKVNPRELEFGAMAMATATWFLSEEGV